MKKKVKPHATVHAGQIGVVLVMADLIRNGFEVAVPIIDTGFDLIAYEGSQYWRVQVKSHHKPKQNLVRTRRSATGEGQRIYDKSVIDAFAFVCLESGDVLVASVNDLRGKTGITLTSSFLTNTETLRDIESH